MLQRRYPLVSRRESTMDCNNCAKHFGLRVLRITDPHDDTPLDDESSDLEVDSIDVPVVDPPPVVQGDNQVDKPESEAAEDHKDDATVIHVPESAAAEDTKVDGTTG